ncbi:hypothetical protein BM477_01430 [Boudabousia marimammalium]|uniref:DUF4244 domain-containing protein n=2 Tax=Boudabousia marimammalium TaxID=156892 RepID=A0A1Q5PT04_9ACTO|nr:hypothetical protein BM477_01430 [Boudabousia marimammalium]
METWVNGLSAAGQQVGESDSEDGMTTTEYAVGTLAAAAIAGTLLAIAKSGAFKTMLLGIFKDALNV